MTSTAQRLADWTHEYVPTAVDLELARMALLDTVAVTLAARSSPTRALVTQLPDAAGWHVTCTAGAPAAAAAAAKSYGLSPERTAHAIVLAVSQAGGVQRAFGSDGKALQVGLAADAGVRAARLAAAGARVDHAVLDQWLRLVGGDPDRIDPTGPAVPGGLAIKLFPCCYAIAAALLDPRVGFDSFTDEAAIRPVAQDLVRRVQIVTTPGGTGLLDGAVAIDVHTRDGRVRTATLELPPGAPGRPIQDAQLAEKFALCGDDVPELVRDLDWPGAAELLAKEVG